MRIHRHLLQSAGLFALAFAGFSGFTSAPEARAADDLSQKKLQAIDEIARQNPGQSTFDISRGSAETLVTSRQFDRLLSPDAAMRVRWALPMPGSVIRRVFFPPKEADVKYVLIETMQNDLIAVRQDNGDAVWWVKLPAQLTGDPFIGRTSVCLVSGGRFVRLERMSGDIMVTIDLPFSPSAGPAAVEVDEKYQAFFVPGADRGVYAFDVSKDVWPPKVNDTGLRQGDVSVVMNHFRQLWRFSALGVVAVSPVVNDNQLVFGCWGNHIYGVNLNGDFTNGKPSVFWDFRSRGGCEAAAVADGPSVLIPSTDGNLYSLTRSDGTLSWRFVAPEKLFFSPQLLTDKELDKPFVVQKSGRNGALFCLNRVTGDPLWQHDRAIRVVGVMALDDNNPERRFGAVVVTEDATLECIRVSAPDTRTASQKAADESSQSLRRANIAWSVPVQSFRSFAANAQSSTVFCTTADGSALCALEENR